MGLLNWLHGRRAPVDVWRPDGLGVTGNGQGGRRGYSIGFVNDALPGREIMVTYYAIYWENDDEWAVERRVEWLIYADGEVWWEDSDTSQVSDTALDDIDEAGDLAAQWAAEDATEAGALLYGTWDGERPGEHLMRAAQLQPIGHWIGHHPKDAAIIAGIAGIVALIATRRRSGGQGGGVTVHNHGAFAAFATAAGTGLAAAGGLWLYNHRQALTKTGRHRRHAAATPSPSPRPVVTHTTIVQHVTQVTHTTVPVLAGWSAVAALGLAVAAGLAVFFNRKSRTSGE